MRPPTSTFTPRLPEHSPVPSDPRQHDPRALAETITRLKVERERAEKLGMDDHSRVRRHLSTFRERYECFIDRIGRGQAPRTIRRARNPKPWEVSDPNPAVVKARTVEPSPRVSVVIVSYNCLGTLVECLQSLNSDADAPPAEFIVVDNASDDGTVEHVAERFPWVRIIANHTNAGFAHAMNQGLASANGPALLALNPDTIVPPGTIGKALDELVRHPDVGMLGVRLVRPDGTFDHACKRGFPTISSALYYFTGLSRLRPRSPRFARYTAGELGENEVGTVDAINGAFMLVKEEAVADVGALDERYWLYAEDIDWCHRFWERGWKVLYWPSVEVVHRKGGSSGDVRSWTLNRAFHRSMWLFYSKHVAADHSRAVSGLVWLGVWAKFASSALVNAFRRPPAHDWNDRRAADRADVDPTG